MINRKRMHSRSNQALKQLISTIDSQRNPSEDMNIRRAIDSELQQKQLFKESFNKIQRIKALLTRHSSHQLMQQLNDIVDLLRGQRVKAKMTLEDLHKLATQVQENDRIYRNKYKQIGTNTDEIIISQMVDKIDQNIQTDQHKQQKQTEMNKDIDKTKKYQSYYKLVCMIDKLKVDYRQILPSIPDLPENYPLPDVQSKKSQYKVLKPQQILKLQNVFITKLANMLRQSAKQKTEDKSKNQFLEIKIKNEDINKSQIQSNDIYKTPEKTKVVEAKTDSSLKKSSNKSSLTPIKKNAILNYRKKSEQSRI